MRLSGLPSLLLLWLLWSPAEAHIGLQPQTVDLQHAPGVGAPLDLESLFAYFPSDDGVTFRFSCHEALLADPGTPTTAVPRYGRIGDGAILVTMLDANLGFEPGVSLYRSTDGGCGWAAVQGLDGKTVGSFAVLADGLTVVATTADLGGALNGLYRSTDGGATFVASDTVDVAGFFLSVRAGGPNTAWASAANPDGGSATLYRTDDGGASWRPVPFSELVEGAAPVDFRVLAVDPANGDRVWVVAAGQSSDYVHFTDDGAIFALVHQDGGSIRDGAVGADGVWLTVGSARPLFSVSGTTFVPRDDAPYAEGLTLLPGGPAFAVNALFEPFALAVLPPGGVVTPRLGFGDITEELQCPAGSRHATVCSPLWPQAQAVLALYRGDDDDDDDDSAGDDDDCACSSTPQRDATPGVELLLPLALLVRRRR